MHSYESTAIISYCKKYRYVLTRRLAQIDRTSSDKRCLFVMLNPSTADAHVDDPTIRRCMSFADSWGCSTLLTVVNIYALRATDPDELINNPFPFGPDNLRHVEEQITLHSQEPHIIVAAWGAHQVIAKLVDKMESHEVAVRILRQLFTVRTKCLGKTKSGAPRHQLYVKGNNLLEPWP